MKPENVSTLPSGKVFSAMMLIIRLLYIIFVIHILVIKAVKEDRNYCLASLCPKRKPHIACGNDGQFKPNCPTNARMVSLKRYRETILNMHNSKRNLIASGRLRRYGAAKRMATMQWDKELALLAALNVKQCHMQHDKCRNTQKFSKSGQSLALIGYNGPMKRKSNSMLIRNRVNAWWKEYKNCNRRIIRKFPKNFRDRAFGHFTVFVAEKNIRVGCAAVRYTRGQNHYFLIGCNYATTNIVGKPIYRAGKAASGCKTGRNPLYTSLCSKKERYSGLK